MRKVARGLSPPHATLGLWVGWWGKWGSLGEVLLISLVKRAEMWKGILGEGLIG